MAEITVEPRNTAAPPTSPEPAAAALPDELLQLPAIQALFAGSPPAVSAPLEDFSKRPEAKLLLSNKDALLRAGMGLYRSLGGDLGVVFNQLYLNGAELQAADKEGRLLQLAPSFDQVNQSIASSGQNNPVLSAKGPSGAAGAPIPNPSQSASSIRSPAPLPAGAQKSLTSARIKNQMLGQPAEGPKPGAGRLLNSILKPVF